MERTLRELQGTACIDLEDAPMPKQEIACTRPFGKTVTAKEDLREAITEFASRAAEKLRRQQSHAGMVLVFIRTSPFRKENQYSRSITVPLRRPTADTGQLVRAALAGLEAIYQPGFKFAKAGVMLLESQAADMLQGELGLEDERQDDRSRLMVVMDRVNLRYGRGTVMLASGGLAGDGRRWAMRQERRTPQYTTRWQDLQVVRA